MSYQAVARPFLRIIWFLIASVFFSLISCKKDKEKLTSRGMIIGMVLSVDNLPISGAKVSLNNEGVSYVYSDERGYYRFNNIDVGDYIVLVAKEKYLSESKKAIVFQDGITKLDFNLQVGEATLEIEKETYDLNYTKTINTVNLKSNTTWLITSSASWLTVNTVTGTGSDLVSIIADENSTDMARVATVTVTAGVRVKLITITQYPKAKLLSVTMTHPITDTVILTFNVPVNEVLITSKYNRCVTALAYNKTPMSNEVRFKYSCGRLGQSYPFQITYKDKLTSYTEDFNVDFFSKRIEFPAIWSSGPPAYFVTDDNKLLWFSVFDTQIVNKIDLETFKVIKTYTFNFKVRKLVYNPYNKLIYILTNTPDIYVMDPGDDGSIVKQIKLEMIAGENEIYPTLYPQTLAFTSSGIGAMVCGMKESSGTSWKMIDSRKNDLVYFHKEKDKSPWYDRIEINYDRSKLIIKAAYTNMLFSFDPVKDEIKDIANPVHGKLGWVVPNKKNDNLYFIQTYEQYIFNPTNSYLSKISYLGNGNAGDFSYRSGEEEIIYAFDTNNFLQVLDYKRQKTLLVFPTINEFYNGKPISTTDGKYLINFTNYTLFRFDTELFEGLIDANKIAIKTKSAFVK